MAAYRIPAEARLNSKFHSVILPLQQSKSSDKEIEKKCNDLIAENNSIMESIDIKSVISRLNLIEDEIGKYLVNRREVTKQGIRALMTSEHQFIFSAAGVAKSLYANQIFSYFRNSSVFALQFCPDTTPDDLFGAYDIDKFKKGEIYHNVEGSIVTNNFAFLDEFMDGNDKLLRSLLSVLLERKFIAGNQVEEAILHTAIATSNYMRISETTEALLDRFLYKSFILPSKDMFTLLKIDKVYNENAGRVVIPDRETQIEILELFYLKRLIKNQNPKLNVQVPIEVKYFKNLVVVSFEEEMKKYRQKYYISPRTISKSNDLMKATALLNGRFRVTEEDVEGLYHMFCTVNEPLNEERTLISQDLFKQVYRKRLQYFHSIKDDLIPLLYIFEFIHQLQMDPKLIKNPMPTLDKLTKQSIVGDLFEKIKHPFMNADDKKGKLNKSHLLDFIGQFESNYNEINQFKNKLQNFIKEVFQMIEG
ncbi:MAG: AAA family ATPase [Calditrichaeota bacterium]|nr:AAA family ATPase [Calditrichota bacterium]